MRAVDHSIQPGLLGTGFPINPALAKVRFGEASADHFTPRNFLTPELKQAWESVEPRLSAVKTLQGLEDFVVHHAHDSVAEKQRADLASLSHLLLSSGDLRRALKTLGRNRLHLGADQQTLLGQWEKLVGAAGNETGWLGVPSTDRILSILKTLDQTEQLLMWDLETTEHNGNQLEALARGLITLNVVRHELLADKNLRRLFFAVRNTRLSAERRRALNEVLGLMDEERKIPTDLLQGELVTTFKTHMAWREAREQQDFSLLAPSLQKLVDLKIAHARAAGVDEQHLYDYQVARYEPGMSVKKLDRLFDPVRRQIPAILAAIREQDEPPVPSPFGNRYFAPAEQEACAREIAQTFGFDLKRGTLKESSTVHPFYAPTGGSRDVRTAVRANPYDPTIAILSTLHEAVGHGMLEQSVPENAPWPRNRIHSFGLHESQALLAENALGRRPGFWKQVLPVMQRYWPEQMTGITAEDLHRHVNRIQPSTIRTDADEVTYLLHVLLRYEIEKALFAPPGERLAVKDIPEAWNRKMQVYLGTTPEHDGDGPLQDVHWSAGMFGYFPAYFLGTLYGSYLKMAAGHEIPDVRSALEAGDYTPFDDWLKTQVRPHSHTRRAGRLMEQLSRHALDSEQLIADLKARHQSYHPKAFEPQPIPPGPGTKAGVNLTSRRHFVRAPQTGRPLKLREWMSASSKTPATELPADEPVMLVVPGLGTTTEHAHPIVSHLIGRHPLIYGIDTYAFGTRPDKSHLRSHRDLVEELTDAVRWVRDRHPGRKVILMAASQGALTSTFVAAENPDLVQGIALVAPAYGISRQTFSPRFILNSVAGLFRDLIPGNRPKVTPIPYAVRDKNGQVPDWLRETVSEVSAPTKMTLMRLLYMTQHGLWNKVPAVTQPTLLVVPEEDKICSVSAMNSAAKSFSERSKDVKERSMSASLPGSDHYMMLNPDYIPTLAQLIEQWLCL